MFRPKRSSLVKRLWKHRVRPQHHEAGSEVESAEELELKSAGQSLLKRLKEADLEALLAAVETRGAESTPCVWLSRAVLQLGKRKAMPHTLSCQLWRWSDLDTNCEVMRHLPCKSGEVDANSVCCNPFHWSRVLPPGTPPRASRQLFPHSAFPPLITQHLTSPATKHNALYAPEYSPMSLHHSMVSYDQPRDDHSRVCWCHVAYWEHRSRVGRLFAVYDASVHIFQHLPQGDGMCLDLLQAPSSEDSVRRTRDKIGVGLVLDMQDGAVWAHNRSDFPIFVNSPTLDIPGSPALIVKKVPPGHTIKIHDRRVSKVIERHRDAAFLEGPFDPYAVRISFAKGWGPHYSRQFITSCPCWVEILLTGNR
ncbi:hypothetical protein CAPTEDRAFT_147083 [Capitella teleta]|uniref:Mothers against decapentaplegic homolog n=1 Tax=Capitella teleta TaxID=283909 RepID=R7USL2_CAPTE|nr:hypothetical protein CAPTEDRAFT_147083 [Capitella teleta]|eukprot:ELU06912.1 hypothetical protein CAPTEDRAFT_147083 [Capitella teleta]